MLASTFFKNLAISKKTCLFLLVLMQALLLLHYMNTKVGFHIDELWSYGLANSYKETYFYPLGFRPDTDNVQFNNWIEGKRFFEYLTVQNSEQFAYNKVYQNQERDVHPPFYYFIIHTICSFFPNQFTKWHGLLLNLFLFIFVELLLYKTMHLFCKSKFIAISICLLYGFGMSAINNFVFIRMYTLLTFFTLVSCYYHLRLLQKFNPNYLLLLFINTLFAGLTHYHFFIFQFFLSLFFVIYFFMQKQYKQFLTYSISVVFGVVGVFLYFPRAYFHMFHSVRGVEATQGVANFSVFDLYLFFQYSFQYILGFSGDTALALAYLLAQLCALFFYSFVFLFTISIVLKCFKISTKYMLLNFDKLYAFIINYKTYIIIYAPILLFIILVTPMISPDIGCFEGRYFFQFYPFVCALIVNWLYFLANNFLKIKKYKLLILSIIIFFVFSSNIADTGDFILNYQHQFNRDKFAQIVIDKTCIYYAPQDYFIHSMSDLFMHSKKVLPTRYNEIDLKLVIKKINELDFEKEIIVIIPRIFVAQSVLDAIEEGTEFKASFLIPAVNHMDNYSLYRLMKP